MYILRLLARLSLLLHVFVLRCQFSGGMICFIFLIIKRWERASQEADGTQCYFPREVIVIPSNL